MDHSANVLSEWSSSSGVALEADVAHVWRVALDDDAWAESLWPVLSIEEQTKARRFFRDVHRRRYVVAHGMLREILTLYVAEPAESLRFADGEHGKPSLIREPGQSNVGVEFNLSHSDDIALVAVALHRPLGVDLERWSEETEYLALAERFFSPAERDALRALAGDRASLTSGFFAAWTRKEAYLKATGEGITRGLHHFDVSLKPGQKARLLADRLDPSATERWAMQALGPATGYSAALVIAAPLRAVRLFDAASLRPGALPELSTQGRAP